jgi:hypothetical protein
MESYYLVLEWNLTITDVDSDGKLDCNHPVQSCWTDSQNLLNLIEIMAKFVENNWKILIVAQTEYSDLKKFIKTIPSLDRLIYGVYGHSGRTSHIIRRSVDYITDIMNTFKMEKDKIHYVDCNETHIDIAIKSGFENSFKCSKGSKNLLKILNIILGAAVILTNKEVLDGSNIYPESYKLESDIAVGPDITESVIGKQFEGAGGCTVTPDQAGGCTVTPDQAGCCTVTPDQAGCCTVTEKRSSTEGSRSYSFPNDDILDINGINSNIILNMTPDTQNNIPLHNIPYSRAVYDKRVYNISRAESEDMLIISPHPIIIFRLASIERAECEKDPNINRVLAMSYINKDGNIHHVLIKEMIDNIILIAKLNSGTKITVIHPSMYRDRVYYFGFPPNYDYDPNRVIDSHFEIISDKGLTQKYKCLSQIMPY